jgi:hypothetical protein
MVSHNQRRRVIYMPPMNLPNISFLKRPIKPVAFALMVSLLVIAGFAWADEGVLKTSVGADFLGGFALAIAIILFIGWWNNNQVLAEYGLLLSASMWIFRACLIAFLNWGGISQEGLYLSFAWAIVAAGSYLLEKADPKGVKETNK